MFVDANLIAYDFMTDFNGPSRHFPNPTYKSGLSDEEKPIYKYGPASSEYPTLTLPCNLYDEWGNIIPYGYYMVILSRDMKFLELYQSNRKKARVKVIKVVEKMYTNEELDEENAIIAKLQKAQRKQKLKDIRKAEEELTALRERAAANSYAEIEDSLKGYYIIRYNHNGKRATGIIQK